MSFETNEENFANRINRIFISYVNLIQDPCFRCYSFDSLLPIASSSSYFDIYDFYHFICDFHSNDRSRNKESRSMEISLETLVRYFSPVQEASFRFVKPTAICVERQNT